MLILGLGSGLGYTQGYDMPTPKAGMEGRVDWANWALALTLGIEITLGLTIPRTIWLTLTLTLTLALAVEAPPLEPPAVLALEKPSLN